VDGKECAVIIEEIENHHLEVIFRNVIAELIQAPRNLFHSVLKLVSYAEVVPDSFNITDKSDVNVSFL
jgi:hypothetical protein